MCSVTPAALSARTLSMRAWCAPSVEGFRREKNGSDTRARTWDIVINSHTLYQLSYVGTDWSRRSLGPNAAALVRILGAAVKMARARGFGRGQRRAESLYLPSFFFAFDF